MLNDVYSRVTSRIIADLERGVRPWHQPWTPGSSSPSSRPLRSTGEPYRGINVLLLWAEAQARRYTSPTWFTYKQAQALGAQVRRGETGSLVVYADRLTRREQDDTGQEHELSIPFMRTYNVFNVEQIDGLPERFSAPPTPPRSSATGLAHADAFVRGTGADIQHGGPHACYIPSRDHIRLPAFDQFRDAESYYATLAHELIHWTGHPTRLARTFGQQRWGDAAYALEELVAELGAAFVCADLQLTPEPRPDHACYIDHWLRALRDDKRCLFSAAAHAQRAADYLTSPPIDGGVSESMDDVVKSRADTQCTAATQE
ncbi:MAG TPA: zincin-like metallopeptidase domain-containing protein [Microvirga sp.]|jgi:antirestriction protein ArdC|nr:zincin-like metallopeptidase domain-containing protein [Microvirga sp.]